MTRACTHPLQVRPEPDRERELGHGHEGEEGPHPGEASRHVLDRPHGRRPECRDAVADEERHRGEAGAVARRHGIPDEQHETKGERCALSGTEQHGPQPRRGVGCEPHADLAEAAEQPRGHEEHPGVRDAVEEGRRDQSRHELGAGEDRHEQTGTPRGPAVGLVRRGEPGEGGVELPRLAGEVCREQPCGRTRPRECVADVLGGFVGQRVVVHRPGHGHPRQRPEQGDGGPGEQGAGPAAQRRRQRHRRRGRHCCAAHHREHREAGPQAGPAGREHGLDDAREQGAGEGDPGAGEEGPGIQRPHRLASRTAQEHPREHDRDTRGDRPGRADPAGDLVGDRREQTHAEHRQGRQHPHPGAGQAHVGADRLGQRGKARHEGAEVRRDEDEGCDDRPHRRPGLHGPPVDSTTWACSRGFAAAYTASSCAAQRAQCGA